MKKLVFAVLILLVLIPFSVRAEDYKGKKCCRICVEWIRNTHGFVRCLKYDIACPCPLGEPAFEFPEKYRFGYKPEPKRFSIWTASIIPNNINIKKIPKTATKKERPKKK